MANHVEACARCEALLGELESGGVALLASLREPAADVGFLAEPQLERARGRVEAMLRQHGGPAARPLPDRDEEGPPASKGKPQLQLRDYRLLGVIGQGGMGTVYKALHTQLDKVVAVKLLPEHRTRDAPAVARFQREMKAVGKLHHPYIVAAHDAGEADGRYFLAMEYVDGLNLAELVRRTGPLLVADACELVRQAALGLDYVHQHGLVHRDIKPSNLMLTAEGQVKILDLGLARLHGDAAGDELTGEDQVMGTTDYMAPEQADDSHAVDGRADVYSLGCTLYKLLVGDAPFAGKAYRSPAQKLLAHNQAAVPSMVERRSDVPPGLIHVIEKMLAKTPDKRQSTAAELAESPGVCHSRETKRRIAKRGRTGSPIAAIGILR
jgi:serine/threonine protein kinase